MATISIARICVRDGSTTMFNLSIVVSARNTTRIACRKRIGIFFHTLSSRSSQATVSKLFQSIIHKANGKKPARPMAAVNL
ncbi:hypothetical protein B9Z55_028527 [Caenorhabditis nigoni]|uniref:Uncharacterized protein n=1 Tax=Caenorhabditis nigoni TaxID=1611254 RepID=A0A2G5SB55_9PELO|nr:hypothetical protein B9Z55_028527 [Caenorhabditis nigoni]